MGEYNPEVQIHMQIKIFQSINNKLFSSNKESFFSIQGFSRVDRIENSGFIFKKKSGLVSRNMSLPLTSCLTLPIAQNWFAFPYTDCYTYLSLTPLKTMIHILGLSHFSDITPLPRLSVASR